MRRREETVPDNRTVIEKWTFGSASGSYTQSADAWRLTWDFRIATRTSVERLYSDVRAGRDLVWGMFDLHGHSTLNLLIQFWDSKDVYRFDVMNRTLEKVASPTDDRPDIIYEPALANESYQSRWEATHIATGYIYIFGCRHYQRCDTLMLYDTDKDGILDGSKLMSEDAWVQGSYHESASYEPVQKN